MYIKKGVKLVKDREGDGSEVVRHQEYLLAIRITLNKGDVVDLSSKGTSRVFDNYLKVRDDGFIESRTRIDRENLIGGIFYAVEGMRIGGYRKVEIAPHLAYREEGIPGVIPPNAKIIAEIEVIKELPT